MNAASTPVVLIDNPPLVRALVTLALVAVALYGLYEVRRWARPPLHGSLSPLQKRLRTAGLVLLILSLSLWLAGTYQPTPRTKPALLRSLVYWSATVLCAVPIVPLALLDSRENLRRLQAERRRLLQETLSVTGETPRDA